jgi:hypothetical protein
MEKGKGKGQGKMKKGKGKGKEQEIKRKRNTCKWFKWKGKGERQNRKTKEKGGKAKGKGRDNRKRKERERDVQTTQQNGWALDHHRGLDHSRGIGHLGHLTTPYPQTWLPTEKRQKARGERDTERSTKGRICRFPTKSVVSSEHPCKIKSEREREKRKEKRERAGERERGRERERETEKRGVAPASHRAARPRGPRSPSRASTMVEAQDGGPLGPPDNNLPPDVVAYGLRPT